MAFLFSLQCLVKVETLILRSISTGSYLHIIMNSLMFYTAYGGVSLCTSHKQLQPPHSAKHNRVKDSVKEFKCQTK